MSTLVFDSSPTDSPLYRCRLTTGRVIAIKQRLVSRYLSRGIPISTIRDAIAAAEAEAWLSGYPHLFLPELADEILEHLRQKRAAGAHHMELAEAA